VEIYLCIDNVNRLLYSVLNINVCKWHPSANQLAIVWNAANTMEENPREGDSCSACKYVLHY
jgi:hypothetical protein